MNKAAHKPTPRKRYFLCTTNHLVLAGVAVALLAAVAVLAGLMIGEHTTGDIREEQPNSASEIPLEEVNDVAMFDLSVLDEAEPVMPLYLQDDPQFASVQYAGESNIGESGCGLVCAAMACEYLTGSKMTPIDLQSVVGDTCTTDGVNDMAKFGRAFSDMYALKTSAIYFDLETAIEAVRNGAVVFASVTGQFGDRSYGGHIVAFWRVEGENVFVRDPASGSNSQRSFSIGELANSNWAYFYTIERN